MNRGNAWQTQLRAAVGPRYSVLCQVVEEAERQGAEIYLVGGPVRDLLLGSEIGDLDLLLSDRLEKVVRGAARRLHATVRLHGRFLTASLFSGNVRLDLSQARAESYSRPGALPRVRPASIEEDFRRRDFSIHAMAIGLSGRVRGRLFDPLEGKKDLEKRRLRVLHSQSFLDDPTRLFRAARYGARLNLRLTRETRKWLEDAVRGGAMDTLSDDRLGTELRRLLAEDCRSAACRRTESYGLFGAISRGWRLGPEARRSLGCLQRVRRVPPWSEAARPEIDQDCALRLLFLDAPARVWPRALERLGTRGGHLREIQADLTRLKHLPRRLSAGMSAGKLDAQLQGLTEPLLLALYCAANPPVRKEIRRFARTLRHVRTPLDGRTARDLGARGVVIGELLRAARARALDGHPIDAAWGRRWLARRQRIR